MRPIVPEVRSSAPGLILLNKKPGLTSFQSLRAVKKTYGNSIGHAGTLDQFAEGLLLVLVNRFTKLNTLFTAFDKVYEADFTFGVETDTLDPEGEEIFHGALPSDDVLLGLRTQFVGKLSQVPPEYSAVHVDGKRAYQRKLAGEILSLPARPIEVFELEVLSWKRPVLTVRIHCSKGTYVRSLARDWGRAAGCGGFVSRLKRWKVGPFSLPESEEDEFWDAKKTFDWLGIQSVEVSDSKGVRNGLSPEAVIPQLKTLQGMAIGLFSGEDFLGVVQKEEGRWTYLFVNPAI